MALIDDLLSYYKLDDNLATPVVLDAHGANNGVCTVNTNTLSAVGIIKTSLYFPNNVATRVGIADGGSLSFSPGTDEYSISAWLYRDGIFELDTIIMDRNTGNGDLSYSIRILADNTLDFRAWESVVGDSFIVNPATIVSQGVWHHVVGTVSTTTAKLYLDGVYIGNDNVVGFTNDIDLGVSIGAWRGGLGFEHPFHGWVDEIGIWGKVLSDGGVALTETATGEVAQLYGAGFGLAYPFVPRPPRRSGIDKYTAKMQGEVMRIRYDSTKDLAVTKQVPYFASAVQLESKVKIIVDGCPVFLVHFYIAYAEELWKKKTPLERQIIYNKWLTRGLDAGLLQAVSCGMFGWGC